MGFLPAFLYALAMSAIPVAEVLWRGRSPATLVLLFWFETLLLLVCGAIRILLHRRATHLTGHYAPQSVVSDSKAGAKDVRRSLGGPNTFLKGFVGINALFTAAHGVFVLLLVFLFGVAGPITAADAQAALTYAVAVQALFLLWDLPRLPHWSFAQLGQSVGMAGLRVLVTQLGLIVGVIAAAVVGSPWGLAGTFVTLRALADASISWFQGLIKQRDLPPGLARVLTRTSGQPVEVLEAEFDALKEAGREVEALLELPIDEARGRR